MKKMLALFLALILSLSSIGAFAEEDAFTCTVDFELALEELMNMAGAAMDDEALGASISMLLPLINKMDLQLTVVDEQAQASLAANNTPIASLTAAIEGDQLIFVSDLFPSYYLTLSQEAAQNLMIQISSNMNRDFEVDEDLVQRLGEHLARAVESLEPHIGQPQAGVFMVSEETFTVKVPIEITLEEAALLAVKFAKDVLSDPVCAPLFAAAELDMDITDLDEVITMLQQENQTNPHPCEVALYSRNNEAGTAEERAVTLAVSQDDQLIAMSLLMLDGGFSGFVAFGDSDNASYDAMYDAALSGQQEAGIIEWAFITESEVEDFYVGFAVCTMGMYMALEANGVQEEDAYTQNIWFHFPSPDLAMLTIKTIVKDGGTITLPVSTEGKTAISLDEIIADPSCAEEKLQPLMEDIEAYGASAALSNLIVAMPDEASELITQLMVMMQDGPTSTAAPAGPGFDEVFVPEEPQAPQTPGGGFMDVIRPTATPEIPAATETPVVTEAPVNPGFFGKPGQ